MKRGSVCTNWTLVMTEIDSYRKKTYVEDSTPSKLAGQRSNQTTAFETDSDGESLPSLDKIRFDDNIVELEDSKKSKKKREKANVTCSDRGHRREEQLNKSMSVPSSSSNESLPSLHKIRFDDHIVSITDPNPLEESNVANAQKQKNDQAALSPETRTAETFRTGNRSDELVLSPPRNMEEFHPQQQDSASRKKSKKRTEGTLANSNSRKGEERKNVDRDKDSARRNKDYAAQNRKEDVQLEQSIRIGGRFFSREETEGLLRNLAQLKKESNAEKSRRHYTNFNRIDSTRTSRAASPTVVTKSVPQASLPNPSTATNVRSRSDNQRVALPRPNYHRIDSCRTSRASTPVREASSRRQKIRVGDRFMNITEAEELLQRMLKASDKAKRSAARFETGIANEERDLAMSRSKDRDKSGRGSAEAITPVHKMRFDSRGVPVPKGESQRYNDDSDCNFGHLNKVMKSDDEVSAIIIAFVFGIIAFALLAITISKVSNFAQMATE
ncbi:hypothetical protein RB195_004796 [Necator americanus]|uniref:Uncharacterized protein n=1 Tax=Necator americanus TaxID=51031 RepID=A0ABR1BLN3_NECAM